MEKVIEAIIKSLGDNSGITIYLASVFTVLGVFLIKDLYKWIWGSIPAKDLTPYFNKKDVQQKLNLFIETRWQNNSPTREDEPLFNHMFESKSKLIPHFIKTVLNENKVSDKFYLVLADSGMGKTTFMINLYVRYNSVFNIHKKYKIKLIPFGYQGNVIEKIKEINKEEIPNTILLLDAFDEYTKIQPPTEPDGLTDDERFHQVLYEVIEIVQDFRKVVITCNKQYFPGEENQPYELKIPTFDNKGVHTLAKFYLSPFDDKEIWCYLNKKYGIVRVWNRKKKQKARRIVHNSPKLMVRPMLLSYIDFLVDGDQHYTNTYEIYEALINKWIEREVDKRERQHANQEKLKQNLHKYSQLVAVKIYEQRKETNSLQLCKADATGVNVELKDYQMTGQSLLTRDADNNWKFAHKSILEFFLAKEAVENFAFAKKLDVTGMDMVKLFCFEFGISSYIKLNYAHISGGEFIMGSPVNEFGKRGDEKQHSVKISDFYMGKYAVCLGDFKRFIDETSYRTDAEKVNSGIIFDKKSWKEKEGIHWCHDVLGNVRPSGEYNHPVLHVTWNDALAYCEWLSNKSYNTFRLPTEAEWEYACRAGTTTPFNTGENLTTDQANYNGNFPYGNNQKGSYRKNTVAVDSFAPNALELYNMHGNVWEWCMDSLDSLRVIRGGSWDAEAVRCRSANRNSHKPNYRDYDIGFRVVFVP